MILPTYKRSLYDEWNSYLPEQRIKRIWYKPLYTQKRWIERRVARAKTIDEKMAVLFSYNLSPHPDIRDLARIIYEEHRF